MLCINPVQFSFRIFHCKVQFSVSQVFKGRGKIVAELVERLHGKKIW
jgi:hypothetical protein